MNHQGTTPNADGSLTQAGVSLFVVQGRDPYDERNKVAMVSTQAELKVPVEQSLQKFDDLNQQQTQALAQQQNQVAQDQFAQDHAGRGQKMA